MLGNFYLKTIDEAHWSFNIDNTYAAGTEKLVNDVEN